MLRNKRLTKYLRVSKGKRYRIIREVAIISNFQIVRKMTYTFASVIPVSFKL